MLVRPFPDSALHSFGQEFVRQKWDFHDTISDTTEMVSNFENTMKFYTDKYFPLKHISISNFDKPYFSEELRKLRRKRQRLYRKFGKTEHYDEISRIFESKLLSEKSKYREKLIKEVKEGKRGSMYSSLKKMSLRCDHLNDHEFTLPEHLSLGLTAGQSAERIANFFSTISQEFTPLAVEGLSQNLQQYINNKDFDKNIPVLSDYDVYLRMKKSRKPNSSVGCDVPVKIVKNFFIELSSPICKIFNKISQTQNYPKHWKIENGVPLVKTSPPESESDLRVISKTPYFSKLYEAFVCDWLMKIIKPYLDPDQFGVKGSSITHYLIQYLHFIYKSLDSNSPNAVIAAYVDMSKVFNRVDHGL